MTFRIENYRLDFYVQNSWNWLCKPSRSSRSKYRYPGVSGLRTDDRQHGMYGPPPYCKRKMKVTELVCANVSGLCWSSDLLA